MKRILKTAALIVLLLLLGYLYLRLTTEPTICPRIERQFLGQKYDVERCSGGGGDYHYFVQLRIYSKNNELLAQRDFAIDTDAKNTEMEYKDDRIIYQNAIQDGEPGMPAIETKVLQFPLTRRDWFDANLDRILFSP